MEKRRHFLVYKRDSGLLKKIVKMTIKKSFLINITAFFSTIPFAAPILISSDVQYPVFLLAGMIFIWDATKKINLNL